MDSYDTRGSLSWEGRYSWSMHESVMEEKLVSKYYLHTVNEYCFGRDCLIPTCVHIKFTFLMKNVRTAVGLPEITDSICDLEEKLVLLGWNCTLLLKKHIDDGTRGETGNELSGKSILGIDYSLRLWIPVPCGH